MREITIEDFRGLGQLVLSKGTVVMVNAEEGTSGAILVDAYLTPSAVFYGVRLDVDDVEPVARAP